MQNKSNFTFLLAFFFLAAIAATLHAQVDASQLPELLQEKKPVTEQGQANQSLRFGPHYKNPNAAGRLKRQNQRSSATNTIASPKRLFGPAYKQRKFSNSSRTPSTATTPKKPRLTGPRYKNRHAKAHF